MEEASVEGDESVCVQYLFENMKPRRTKAYGSHNKQTFTPATSN